MRLGEVVALGSDAMVLRLGNETTIVHDDIAVSAGAVTLIRSEFHMLRALQ